MVSRQEIIDKYDTEEKLAIAERGAWEYLGVEGAPQSLVLMCEAVIAHAAFMAEAFHWGIHEKQMWIKDRRRMADLERLLGLARARIKTMSRTADDSELTTLLLAQIDNVLPDGDQEEAT